MSNSFVLPIDRAHVRVGLGAIKMKGYLHSSKLLYYWSLIIRFFSLKSRTLIVEVFPYCTDAVSVLYGPSQLGQRMNLNVIDDLFERIYSCHRFSFGFKSWFIEGHLHWVLIWTVILFFFFLKLHSHWFWRMSWIIILLESKSPT